VSQIVQGGRILPLEPLPADWSDGQRVVIEPATDGPFDERADIEKWFADLEALGSARYEPEERAALERIMAEADREAKESVKRRYFANCKSESGEPLLKWTSCLLRWHGR
jgi:hypothetical protein